MATPLGSMRIDLELDSSKFASNLAASKRAVQYFQREAQTLDATMRNSGQSMNLLSAKHKTLSQAIDKQADVVKRLHESFQKLDPGSAKWEKAAIEIEREKGKLEGLRGELKRVESQMKSVERVEAFKKPQADIQLMEAKLGTLNTALTRNGDNMQLLRQKSDLLKSALSKQQQIVLTLKEHLSSLKPGSPEWQEASVQVENHKAKLLALKGELDDVQDSLKRVHAENSRWGQTSNLLTGWSDKLKRGGSVLREMGDAMRPVSEVLQRGFIQSARKAADFSSQMTTTRALLRDTFPEGAEGAGQLDTAITKLSESSKKWAREYGISTADINNGMQEIIKAGFDANQTMDAMPSILNASRASGDAFGVVMQATTSILSQYGLAASDANRVTDSLAYVANMTKSGFSDMGLAMEYVGPVANSLNMSIEETAAVIGILSNKGIEGEKAGTALRGALSKLLKPSKQNAQAFEQLGFSAEEFQTGAIKLPDIIDRIKESTKNLTDEQRAALIAQAFGVEAQTGMNALVSEGSEAIRNLTERTKEAKGYTKQLADEMGGSAQANMAKFKSSLEVLAINVGEKLLPHLIKLAEQGNKLVDWFGSLPPEVQQASVMFAGFLAVSYPLLNILGNLSTVGGGFLGVLGKMAAKRAAATTLVELGTSAGTASTALAGTAGKAGLLTSAISAAGGLLPALGILGGVLVGGAVVVGLAHYAQKALDARQRTEEWGAAVSATEAKELSNFKSKVDETTRAMETFGTEGVQDVEAVKQAFSGLTEEITKLVDENLAKDIDMAKKLGFSEEEIQAIKDRANETKNTVNAMAEDVTAIYSRANEQRRQLSAEEKQIVLSAQTALIQEQLEQLKLSGKEKEAVIQAMNGQIDELNRTQLAKALSTTKQWIEEENAAYKEKKDFIKRMYGEREEDKAIHDRKMAELEAEHAFKMDAYGEKYMAIQERLLASDKSSAEHKKITLNQVKKTMEELGLSYEEFEAKMAGFAEQTASSSTLVASYWQGMSEEARLAVNYWNSIVLDPVTGQVKTNAQEEIQKALEAEGGWESMQLSLKEGRLTTTAKIAVGEALVSLGQWEGLSPEEKALVVDGQPAIKAIVESKENLAIWNALPEGVKQLLADNQQFMGSAETAKATLTAWNLLQPHQKDLIANDLASGKTEQAQQAINSLVGKTVGLDADDLPALQKIMATNDALNGMSQTNIPVITAEDGTAPAVAQATASINSPVQASPIPMFGLDSTAPAVAGTTASVNSPRQASPIGMYAANLTAGPVNLANQAVNSPRQNSPAGISAQDNTASGVSSARASVNSVQNRTVTITTIFKQIGRALGFAKGTNYHPGGLSLVNDQKGPLYKELITLPSGRSFIPEGRDVLMDLPRGSKVLPARQTRDLMAGRGIPRYADGVGYAPNSPILRTMDKVEERYQTRIVTGADNGQTVALLKEILRALKEGRPEPQPVVVNLATEASPDYRKLAEEVGNLLAYELQRKTQLRGG